MLSPPIFRFTDSSRPYYLQTDASLEGISYILGQAEDDVISYGGRGLHPCEKKWSISQLECFSSLTGIWEYHVYLAAAPFVVYTDNISLKHLQSLKVSANNRLARWSLALQPYKFTTEHVQDKKLTAADGLSRRPHDEPGDLSGDEELQDDSFIAQIQPAIFDSTPNIGRRPKQPHRQWHVLSINARNDDTNDTQNPACADNMAKPIEDSTADSF